MRNITSSIVAGLCLAVGQFGQAQDFTILPTDDPASISIGRVPHSSAYFADEWELSPSDR
jgi:hypothetical protein